MTMHTVDDSFSIAISLEAINASENHIFTVETDGEEFRSVVPEPLAEDFAMGWLDAFSAWHWIIHIRENHISGKAWEIKDKLACAKVLWSEFGDIPISDDDEIDQDFLHFEKGTDRFDIWHWFEDEFNLSIATDLQGL